MIKCCFEPIEMPEFLDSFVKKCSEQCKWMHQYLKIIAVQFITQIDMLHNKVIKGDWRNGKWLQMSIFML